MSYNFIPIPLNNSGFCIYILYDLKQKKQSTSRIIKYCFYTFAHLNRRFYISQTSFAGLLNITKAVYQWQSNSCQSTFKDAEPYGSAFRMCNGV